MAGAACDDPEAITPDAGTLPDASDAGLPPVDAGFAELPGFAQAVETGTTPVDALLAGVVSQPQPEDPAFLAAVQTNIDARNAEVEAEVTPLLEQLAATDDYYRLALPITWSAGSFTSGGFFQLVEEPGAPVIILTMRSTYVDPADGTTISVNGPSAVSNPPTPCTTLFNNMVTVAKADVTLEGDRYSVTASAVEARDWRRRSRSTPAAPSGSARSATNSTRRALSLRRPPKKPLTPRIGTKRILPGPDKSDGMKSARLASGGVSVCDLFPLPEELEVGSKDEVRTNLENEEIGQGLVPQAPNESGPVREPSAVVAVRGACKKKPVAKETIRFAKHDGPEVTFPLSSPNAAALKGSNAVSPFLPTNPRVLVQPEVLDPPTHPGDAGYWSELEKVVDIQIARAQGKTVADLLGDRTPKLFQGYSLDQAAEAVHRDLPADWPTALLEQLLTDGAKFDSSVVPHLSQDDFVNTIVTTVGVLGMATAAVSPSAFACKWHEGRARPEEAAWGVDQGELAGAPSKLKTKIRALGLQTPESFTAYPEGCPKHPSWPAMHSAASISSMVLAVLFDLNEDQLAETRNVDYAVSTFRTVAGVHFESDNIAGLKIGQKVMEEWLPDFLAQYAGADPDVVRAKIEKIRHDWDRHPPLKPPA